MKYVIVRCEDRAPTGARVTALLEGAKLSHLQQLAQAGAAGLVIGKRRAATLNRYALHRALLGLRTEGEQAQPAACYLASAGAELAPGETAWCCELVTQQDGAIIDPSAGRIPTKESRALVEALNSVLGSEGRRWQVGEGSHHLLMTHEALLRPQDARELPPPELLVGVPWRRHLPKGQAGHALAGLIARTSEVLEEHAVNRVRVDLGENPANMVWCWGPVAAAPGRPPAGEVASSGLIASDSFLLRGLARTLEWEWREGPASFHAATLQRFMKGLIPLLDRSAWTYLHFRVASGDPVERLCAMERLDHLVLKPLSDRLPSLGPWRLLMAIDDRLASSVPFVAIGTSLPQHPVVRLSAEGLEESALRFEHGDALHAWFTTPGAAHPGTANRLRREREAEGEAARPAVPSRVPEATPTPVPERERRRRTR